MKKGRVISFKSCNNLLRFFSHNTLLIFFCIIFIIGILFGVFCYGKNDFLKELIDKYITDFISFRTDNKVFDVFIKSFFTSLLVFVISFSFGTSLSGAIFIPLLLFFIAFIFGEISALLYSEYSLNGFAFHTVIILPSAIIFIISLIFSCIESIKFSILISKLTLPATVPQNLSHYFKYYCFKYIIYILIVLISAITDALISVNFIDNFKL